MASRLSIKEVVKMSDQAKYESIVDLVEYLAEMREEFVRDMTVTNCMSVEDANDQVGSFNMGVCQKVGIKGHLLERAVGRLCLEMWGYEGY